MRSARLQKLGGSREAEPMNQESTFELAFFRLFATFDLLQFRPSYEVSKVQYPAGLV
jgi:hypothetical protein